MPNSTGEDNFLGRKNACPLNLIETSPHIDGNSKPDWGIESNRDNNYPGPMNARDDNVDYAREIIRITTRPNRPTGDNYKFVGSIRIRLRSSIVALFIDRHVVAITQTHNWICQQMTNRQKNGIGCFVLAAVLAGVAVNNTFVSPTFPVGDDSGLGVSRLVGAFLPSIVVLALGLWLFQKPKT